MMPRRQVYQAGNGCAYSWHDMASWRCLRIPNNLTGVFVCLIALGLMRNGLEIMLGVDFDGHWFSWAPDILLSMAAYPLFLCFYGAGWVCVGARCLKARVDPQAVFGVAFYLQFLHLVIPLIDWIGNVWLKMPRILYLAPYRPHPFYTTIIVMTTGIIVAWLVTARTFWVLLRTLGLSRLRTVAVLLVAFNAIFWPVYIFFPTFNTVFEWLTGMRKASGTFYGYGVFFVLGSLPGLWYWRRIRHA